MAEETVVKETLSPEMIREGKKLTHHMIREGIPIAAALWRYLPEENSWRLVVGWPQLKEEGPKKAYKKIDSVLNYLDLSSLSLADITVVDSNEPLISSLRKSVYSSGARLSQSRVDDQFIDDAFIYMAREPTILKVFISSPGDLEEERAVIEKVIRELNSTWGDSLNLRLEPIKWETHSYPGIASYPQQVINEQIGDDYDIFIGLLWKRFGTETPNAKSGTEEEFERAYKRHLSNADGLQIMFYFKEAPISPSEIDPEQLKRIIEFRKKLGEKGVLYRKFTDVEEFEGLLRTNLGKLSQDWQRSKNFTPTNTPVRSSTEIIDDEELGFLDLIDSALDGMENVTEIAERMSATIKDMGDKISERADELNDIGPIDHKDKIQKAKKILNRAAFDLIQFTTRMKTEIPLFEEAWSSTFDSTSRAASILISDFNDNEERQLNELFSEIERLLQAVSFSRNSVQELRETVQSWPRVLSKLNKAKRETIRVLDWLIEEFDSAMNLAKETLKLKQQVQD